MVAKQKKPWDLIADGALMSDIEKASDRALAIVIASYLDAMLEELLRAFLVERAKAVNPLFEGRGVLSTFSSKIELSFALGLIGEGEAKALNTIREIRNAFAHELGNLDFTDMSISAKCANLRLPIEKVFPETCSRGADGEFVIDKLNVASSDDPRGQFVEVMSYFGKLLVAREASASIDQREVAIDFASSSDVLLNFASSNEHNSKRAAQVMASEDLPLNDRAMARELYEASLVRVSGIRSMARAIASAVALRKVPEDK
ncbi:MltR family transcriptional regulator [Pandoraea sputorum]|uniref:MltR family transcriptional regulator n=1 Tax=Pandoraea sputorum TaxID=93222 RepID=UPI00125C1CE7|nr:MltR family transcriptional regulator [Pandoraea sputorum]VVE78140.1 hypothetical protein PSP31120_01520 [Pandoraea sputorum]